MSKKTGIRLARLSSLDALFVTLHSSSYFSTATCGNFVSQEARGNLVSQAPTLVPASHLGSHIVTLLLLALAALLKSDKRSSRLPKEGKLCKIPVYIHKRDMPRLLSLRLQFGTWTDVQLGPRLIDPEEYVHFHALREHIFQTPKPRTLSIPASSVSHSIS
ncbi:hypothetical protein B0H16DRAFT_1537571 [Mycena metata]|uniref:Uncharacterized protein n=1 Tax=Mycena metata TaxID=1033252 RepID=A0AAD7J7T9_9AGAR|nr:hypothetical protein B0H16DRAFT_1537571 [Mycena metata]